MVAAPSHRCDRSLLLPHVLHYWRTAGGQETARTHTHTLSTEPRKSDARQNTWYFYIHTLHLLYLWVYCICIDTLDADIQWQTHIGAKTHLCVGRSIAQIQTHTHRLQTRMQSYVQHCNVYAQHVSVTVKGRGVLSREYFPEREGERKNETESHPKKKN